MGPINICVARQFVNRVRTKLAGDDRHIYHQFIQFLNQLYHQDKDDVDISMVISTVQKLFQNHPDLFHAFKTFLPTAASPDSYFKASVDFIDRVRTRFGAGPLYFEFLDCMHAYASAEISAAAAFDKAVGLFGEDDDLVAEFMHFAPGSSVRRERSSEKRKIVEDDDDDQEWTPDKQRKKKRVLSLEREKMAAKKVAERDNENEDSLCEVDVRLGNLESVRERAQSIADRLLDGRMSPAEFRLDEEFSPLNLAFMRKLDRKILDQMDKHLVHGLEKLMEMLTRKKASLEKERIKIVQRWNKLRLSSDYRLSN